MKSQWSLKYENENWEGKNVFEELEEKLKENQLYKQEIEQLKIEK